MRLSNRRLKKRRVKHNMENYDKNSRRLTISIGNSGEYFVAGELERRDFSVAVPMSNTPVFDILAVNRKTNKQYAIQVKTTSYGKYKWIVYDKFKDSNENNNIYCVFVHLHKLDCPEYFIIPRKKVIEYLENKYKDSKVLNKTYTLSIKENDELMQYKNAWDIL